MSLSTTNTHKNHYGRKKRHGKKPSKRLTQQVNQIIAAKEAKEVELKYRDREYNGSAGIDTAGVILPLSDPQTGTSTNQLIGRSFLVKSILLRYQLFIADSFNSMRCIVFRWNSNSVPTVPDVLEDYVTSAAAGPLSPIRIENSSNIQVLYSNVFALSSGVLDTAIDKVFIQRNMKVQYNDDGSKGIGHIYMLIVSDSVAVSHPTYTVISRCRYLDP